MAGAEKAPIIEPIARTELAEGARTGEIEMNALDIALTQADELGLLMAEIATLTKKADAIKDAMKDAATAGGDAVTMGNLFKASVIEANRKVTDWKAIAKAYSIPAEVIEANTSTTAVFSVKVTAL